MASAPLHLRGLSPPTGESRARPHSPKRAPPQNCDGLAQRKLFSCKRCPYSTDRKNNLKRHMIAMHELTAQKLECCGLRFLSKADLKAHNSRFHSEGYKCPVCGQHFVRKALLERHFSVHTGEKKFACECGYRTSHKSNLERHYKTHLKEGSCLVQSEGGGLRFNLRDKTFGGTKDGTTQSSRGLVLKIRSHHSSVLYPSKALPPRPSVILQPGARSLEGPNFSKDPPKKFPLKRGFTVEEILSSDTEVEQDSSSSFRDPVKTLLNPYTNNLYTPEISDFQRSSKSKCHFSFVV